MVTTTTEIVIWPEAGTEHELDDDALVAAAMDGMRNTAPFEGVICVAREPTTDRRAFTEFSWSELPIALRNNIEESHGGQPHTTAVLVGRIDTLEMRGRELYATGVLDLDSEHGREAHRLMGTRDNPGFLRGVSIDGSERPGMPSTVEMVFPAGCADLGPESTPDQMANCMEPQLTIWDHVRVRAATLTPIQAIEGATLYLSEGATEMPDELEREYDMTSPVAASSEPTMADVVESLTAAAATIVIPDLPMAEWFLEPEDLPEFSAITITDSGRLYGLLAPANVAHRGYEKKTTVPMKNVDYTTWQNKITLASDADGNTIRIATGAVTLDCGHASTSGPLARSPQVALDHYDSTCSLFATACVGENRHGVWIAGAVLPDVTPGQVARALACALSGDWRPSKNRQGWREMVAALLVPVAGFAVANKGPKVTFRGDALVASSVPMRFESDESHDCGCSADVLPDTANAARAIALSVGRDKATRARDLYLSVNP